MKMSKLCLTFFVLLGLGLGCQHPWCATPKGERSAAVTASALTDATAVASALSSTNIWILPQPKEVTLLSETFALTQCQKIEWVGSQSPAADFAMSRLAGRLAQRSGVNLAVGYGAPQTGAINLGIFPNGQPDAGFPGIMAADLQSLAAQGYVLHIGHGAVSIAAKDQAGLFYGTVTLAQVAADRQTLPGLHLRDWPAMAYRGAQQDITRGQVPTPDTLKSLTDTMAEAKMNVLELYIENYFKFPSHPDAAPPESLTPAEGRALFDYATQSFLEVHPMLQVLGHSGNILKLPQYQDLAIRQVPNQPWATTFDIRKPEAVAFVKQLIDDVCVTFPGKLFNVDITEIDSDGLLASGMTSGQITDLVFNYVLQLNETVKAHNQRLMIVQGPLGSTGAMAGMGSKLSQLPKDIIVGSYYCAGGPYQPAWQTDFPRLRDQGLSFFAQPWIYSHNRIYPWVGGAADFSDLEVSRGLLYGAVGSTTCDWGDEGHFHLVGTQWYPFVYHGNCAWTGARLDRNYFNQAYTRIYYGVPDDSIARAINLTGNVSAISLSVKDAQGNITQQQSSLFEEFFGDPFTASQLTSLADPVAAGRAILAPADQAVNLLADASTRASRNQDNLRQLLFGARSYQALGNKLVAAGDFNNSSYPRADAGNELASAATAYDGLRSDYVNLFLAEDRPNSDYDRFVGMFNNSIIPLFQKSGKSRPYINTFSQPGDIAGAIIRWGLVGQVGGGAIKFTFNSGAPDQPGGSQWGFSPCMFLLVPGLNGDYQEFSMQITVKGSPIASIPVTLTSMADPGHNNSYHRFTLHEGTQTVRFNTLANHDGSTPWTACGYFWYLELQMPDVARIAAPNNQYDAWKNTEFTVDWLAVTKDPNFTPPKASSGLKEWPRYK